jgi:glycine oxidase
MIPVVELAKASLKLYPEFAASVEESCGKSVGFRQKGTLEALFPTHAREELSALIAVHHRLGLRAEALGVGEARKLEPQLSEEIAAGILRPDEAAIDNRALMAGILVAAEKSGIKIFSGVEVKRIWKENGRCAGLLLANERIAAKWTIIAAGCFSSSIEGAERFTPVKPAKGQMVALRGDGITIERVLWSDKVYLVPRSDGRILAGSTIEYVHFDKQVTAGAVQKILSAAIELAPGLAVARVEETWAGLRPDTPDHLPIIGGTDLEGLLMATGHFRSGILLAAITARLIREWVMTARVSVDWAQFSPMRFEARAAGKSAESSG